MSDEKYAVAANLPIYGTGDAGRRFYLGFREVAVKHGLTENKRMKSCYSFSKNGEVMIAIGAHVDDMMWAAKPGFENIIPDMLKNFEVKEIFKNKFRLCGREYDQDTETKDVKITCKDNIEKIFPINYHRGDRSLESSASQGEISQLKSVNGSISWICRQCRPEHMYTSSKLQSVANTAKLKHLETCNALLQEMVATSEVGLFYKAGAFKFADAVQLTISDASWAGETLVVDDKVFPRRSQYGRINMLGQPEFWKDEELQKGYVHFIGWKSGLIKRQCRSTFRAETQGLGYAKEWSQHFKAFLCDLRGTFDKSSRSGTDWETYCGSQIKDVWMTDCQSLHDYLINPNAAGCEDKRLEIDLEDLREYLWFHDGKPKDFIEEKQTDRPRWIDTSVMICDPLTKGGNAEFRSRLVNTMMTGVLDLEPTVASTMRKLRQGAARRDKTLAKANPAEEVEG